MRTEYDFSKMKGRKNPYANLRTASNLVARFRLSGHPKNKRAKTIRRLRRLRGLFGSGDLPGAD
jgi:hypothetical protein